MTPKMPPINLRDHKGLLKLVLIVLIFILITVVFTYPASLNMDKLLYGSIYGTDNRASFWSFWWQRYAHSHGLNENVISVINAPFGIDTSKNPYSWLWMSITRWFSINFNEVVTYNILLFFSFVLSALTMYLLAFHLTGDSRSSVLAGLIYAFCPYHFNKAWEHFLLSQIQWMPLFILAVLKLYKKFNLSNIIFYLLAFTLTLTFDFTYTYISLISVAGFFVYVIYYHSRNESGIFIKRLIRSFTKQIKFFLKLASISLIGLLLNAQLVISVMNSMFLGSKLSPGAAIISMRPLKYLFTQSARPLNYFLPASAHPLFGKFTKAMFGSIFYGRNSIEQTLYLGWIPLILAFIAYKNWKNKRRILSVNNDDFAIRFFIFTAILAFLFSLPPYLDLFLFKIYFPSFYMHKLISVFRAYARFGILVMLSVSVLAGFGLKYVLEKIKTAGAKSALTVLATCFILLEFTNIPPFRFTDVRDIPEVFSWLKQQREDFIIAEYPMVEGSPGEAGENYDYLYYQTIHQKRMVNGAIPGSKGFEIKEKILKVDDIDTPGILKSLGTRYVILHTDLYKEEVNEDVVDVIGEVPDLDKTGGYKFIKGFGEALVYEVIASPVDLGKLLNNKGGILDQNN